MAGLLLAAAAGAAAAQGAEYKGFRVCTKCHDHQGDSWRSTAHAKAFESLKANVKAAAKTKAKLDPARDYTQDKDCLTCHVTGFGEPGGYSAAMDAGTAGALRGVTCESCHGAGGSYRDVHGKAGDKLKTSFETTDRKALVEARQNFDYEQACAKCHLNYPGSNWSGARAPHTPFTPSVDPKYAFDFLKAVRREGEGNPVHTHFKLRGVFKGEPVPAIRAELQQTAKEPEE
jgi:hypothetical protein